VARGVRLTPEPGATGTRGWLALAALLALGAGVTTFGLERGIVDATALDWQPGQLRQAPWRAITAAWVHYSHLHLLANLAGAALVGALGSIARVPTASVVAWLLAWPLTQLGLLLRPDLAHYGGLSGVLHAGVAVVAVQLVLDATGARRAIGLAIGAGLALKVGLEAPWGPALRHPPQWDIATAPFAHASGLAAGLACALAARAVARTRARTPRGDGAVP